MYVWHRHSHTSSSLSLSSSPQAIKTATFDKLTYHDINIIPEKSSESLTERDGFTNWKGEKQMYVWYHTFALFHSNWMVFFSLVAVLIIVVAI